MNRKISMLALLLGAGCAAGVPKIEVGIPQKGVVPICKVDEVGRIVVNVTPDCHVPPGWGTFSGLVTNRTATRRPLFSEVRSTRDCAEFDPCKEEVLGPFLLNDGELVTIWYERVCRGGGTPAKNAADCLWP